MTTQERCIAKIKPCLFPFKYNQKAFRDGNGYVFACPLCSHAQEKESKRKEKCAALYPLAGSFQWIFNCSRGCNGGKGNDKCSRPMRFDSFLQAWNPPLYRQYSREKEVAKRLRSTGSLGPEDFRSRPRVGVSSQCS